MENPGGIADNLGMVGWCKRLSESAWFGRVVMAVILFNAVLIGVESSREMMAKHGPLLLSIGRVLQGIFVVEILIRLIAHYPRVDRFFKSGWNVFDFCVVAITLLPAAGPLAGVARLARVLRVLRLITAWPELRLIVSTMLRSIPSMGHVILLLTLLIYVYAVLGVQFFGERQPEAFGSLGQACLSLFVILTLEGWADVQAASLEYAPWAWIYYGSFVVVAVFVVINLFIAVVTNNLQQAKLETEASAPCEKSDLLKSLDDLKRQIEQVESRLRERK